MNARNLLRWFGGQLYNYNLFIPDENDYNDDDNEPEDPVTIVRHQRYATRLYVPLLIITFYVLFFIAFVSPQSQLVVVSNITPPLFDQLRLEYGETLLCPCSTTTVPYSAFVYSKTSFHPVCSSVFVSREWIEALYLPNASSYLPMDFRTTASSQWNLSASFDCYYETCAPIYCTYLGRTQTTSFVRIVITLISTISGLTVTLRLITPLLVKFIFHLLQPKVKTQQQVRTNLLNRVKILLQKLAILFNTKLINLNMFPLRTFGSNIDRMRGIRLGQLTTRLHIVLLIIGLAILTLHTIIQPQILTETFDKPSLNVYNRLIREHNDTLQCSCSLISSVYDRYVTIEHVFHQVCSSSFASNEWRIELTAGLVSDLSVYDVKDYRRFLSAHLQFLRGLCDLSMQSVNGSSRQFLSSLFITTQLQSPIVFHTHIDSLVKQSKFNASTTFARLLFLLRVTNHGNAIISTYETNFKYYFPHWHFTINLHGPLTVDSIALTEPITYDNECSCALNKNCTTQAAFIDANSSKIVPIKGFKMGCTPSESFLASTLECFYDSSCINLIQQQINDTNTVPVLLFANASRFPTNTLIIDLIDNLFIESWSTTTNYSAYFEQCSPSLCSYTYIQQLNSLYTVTLLLGLYGGLNFVLKWICPNIIHLLDNVYRWRQKRLHRVEPTYATEMATIEIANATPSSANVPNDTIHSESVPMASSPKSALLRSIFFGLFLVIFVVAAFIGPLVYLGRLS